MTKSPNVPIPVHLTQADMDRFGAGFSRLYPIDGTPCWGELLQAIDVAEQEMRLSGERVDKKLGSRHRN